MGLFLSHFILKGSEGVSVRKLKIDESRCRRVSGCSSRVTRLDPLKAGAARPSEDEIKDEIGLPRSMKVEGVKR